MQPKGLILKGRRGTSASPRSAGRAKITQRSGSIVASALGEKAAKPVQPHRARKTATDAKGISRGHPITIGWLQDGRVYGVLVYVGRREVGCRGWTEEALQEHAQLCPVLWASDPPEGVSSESPLSGRTADFVEAEHCCLDDEQMNSWLLHATQPSG